MSLSPEQQKELKQLASELEKIERFAVENKIDLDDFVSEFNESRYAVHMTDSISLSKKDMDRKKAFGQVENEKSDTTSIASK